MYIQYMHINGWLRHLILNNCPEKNWYYLSLEILRWGHLIIRHHMTIDRDRRIEIKKGVYCIVGYYDKIH